MFGFSVRTLQNAISSPRSVGSPSMVSVASPSTINASPARLESPGVAASPKTDVGEIDTRAPFESVKAAVSLFGDVVTPRARPVTKKTRAEEQRLLQKEAQHHMILKELDYYREKIKNIESTKIQALRDLQAAKRTVQELTNKLEMLSESKQEVMATTESVKSRGRALEERRKSFKDQLGTSMWKLDLDEEREQYKACSAQLIACKQELTNLRQDFDAALGAKLAAFQKAEGARQAAETNWESKKQLESDVATLSDTLNQVKLASLQSEEEHLRLIAEKEVHFLVHKSAKEVAEREIQCLEEEQRPEENLERKLEEANEGIKVLQDQLHDVRTADLNSLEILATEVLNARKHLQELVHEETSLRTSVDCHKRQVDCIRKKIVEAGALEAELEVERLQDEVKKGMAELNAARSRNVTGEMLSNLERLTKEIEVSKHESETLVRDRELIQQEEEAAKCASREAEEKLEIAMREAEEAKAAKKRADDQIRESPPGTNDGNHVMDEGPVRRIRLSIEEFKVMTQKIEDCRKEADGTVVALKGQMQGMAAREREARWEVEGMAKELERLEREIEGASQEAERADAMRAAVEEELRKWREWNGGRGGGGPPLTGR